MTNANQPDTGFVEVSGAPLYYEAAGVGPALVLIHEGLADSRMYDDQFNALAQRYRVLRYDLPGFGRSGTPVQPFMHHEVLHTLLQHLGISRAALLGMSMGAGIAIDCTLTYPAMVGALALMAPGFSNYPISEAIYALVAPLVEAFQAGDFVRGIDLSIRLWVDGLQRTPEEVNPAVRERVRTMYTDVLRRSREGNRQADQLDPPSYTRLGEIHVPTLVVVGTGDLPNIQEQADLLAQTIPGARKVVLPHVAHLLNMEHPAEINRLILDFLAEYYPSSSR